MQDNFDMQELIEKATPKKVLISKKQNIRYITKYQCPTCNKEFIGEISNYCYHCGQALKWED